MNSKKYLIFFFLIFFVSCANSKLSKSESCTYPQEKLEKGGLINRIIDKDAIEDSFKKYICYEYPKYRLVYPIPYSANVDFSIMGEKIKLSEKNFRESRIIIKEKKFNKISENNLKRIKIERELFNEKILIRTQKKYRSTEFVYPAEGIISSEYGVKRFINNLPRNPHLGLDIAADKGTSVIAPENGEVILIADFFYRGKLIIIDHGNGIISTYSHLDEILVSEGDLVSKKSKIATIGSSGRVTGPHLHFEIILFGTKIDPLLFL